MATKTKTPKTSRNVPIAFTPSGHVQPHNPRDQKPRGPLGDSRPAVLLVENVPADVQVQTVVLRVKGCVLHGLDAVGYRIPWEDIAEARQGTLVNYKS